MKYKVHFPDDKPTYVEKLPLSSGEGHGLKKWKPKKKGELIEFIWICVEADSEKDAIQKAISMADAANNE